MLKVFFRIRYMSVLTVLASLLGTLLMFLAAALDVALSGLALLYFAYSIYFLFVASDRARETAAAIDMPEWLDVKSLREMKKTLLEVVVVLLGVLFLKLGLEVHTGPAWELLVIPAGIIALAAGLKLINFYH